MILDQRADDAALMAAAQRGDRDAFAVLYRRHRHEIAVWFYRNLPRSPDRWRDIEDAESTVWLRAWRKRHQFRDPHGAGVRSWLYTIARHHTIDLTRKRARQPSVPLSVLTRGELEPYLEGGDDETIERRLAVQEVRRAVAALTPEQRRAVALRWLYDVSIRETAALLGTTEEGVKQRQVRGFNNLRKALAAYAPETAA